MAMKDKFSGKRNRGMIVNRHRQLHAGEASPPDGQYMVLITDSLTPIIGPAANPTNITVVNGMLE